MRFEASTTVAADPRTAFDLTQDYARRLTWDPFLRSATLLDGAKRAGVGVRACCVSSGGMAMETEYVSYAPPRVAAVKMTRGPAVISEFAGTWEFTGPVQGPTTITFRYHVRSRPRWLAWLLDPIVSRWFARETRTRLAALEAVLGRAT